MNEDTLVTCENVSKSFCRSLKRSLWYGVTDILKEFNPASGAARADRPAKGRGKGGANLREGEFWAVQNVSFELKRGECLGLIGHNGAGKTTLLKMLNGLIKPDSGTIAIRGRVGALIALGAGFNPVLSGRENIYTNGLIKGLTKKEIDSKVDEIIDFAEIAHAIDAPVRTFSSGMQARLGFAIAAQMNPDVLLIDEVLAVGDISFRNKCIQFIEGVRNRGGGVILVTHSFNQVLSTCPTAMLMDKGKRVAFGTAADVIDKALEIQFHVEDDQPQNAPREASRGGLTEDSGVRIVEYSFSGEDGKGICSGKPFVIDLVVESNREINDLFWSFSIWTQDGTMILVSKISSDSGLTWNIKKGRSAFRAVVGPVWLPPRRYSIRLGLATGNFMLDLLGFEPDRIWITVESEEVSKSSVRTTVANDMVVMDVEWDPEMRLV